MAHPRENRTTCMINKEESCFCKQQVQIRRRLEGRINSSLGEELCWKDSRGKIKISIKINEKKLIEKVTEN